MNMDSKIMSMLGMNACFHDCEGYKSISLGICLNLNKNGLYLL